MDAARLSRFPHLTWLPFPVSGDPNGTPLVVSMRGVCHAISLTRAGSHTVRWIVRGRETRWTERPKAVHLLPADGEAHTFITTPQSPFSMAALFIPEAHVAQLAESEWIRAPGELSRLLLADDAILGACVASLGSSARGADTSLDGHDDEVARRLILRLCELNGMAPPDWHDDASVFQRRTLEHLVAYIDEHLRTAPSLADMALLVGLSPSHFAKKFRQSTGLSLHRFVAQRRVRRAFDVLRAGADHLAGVAIDLGFSSQSHFTRIFGGLTGMTPATYRRQFGRIVG